MSSPAGGYITLERALLAVMGKSVTVWTVDGDSFEGVLKGVDTHLVILDTRDNGRQTSRGFGGELFLRTSAVIGFRQQK